LGKPAADTRALASAGSEELGESGSAGARPAGWRPVNLIDDLIAILVMPSALFGILPRENRARQALTLFLLLHVLIGWGIILTAVREFEIGWVTQLALTVYGKEHEGDEDSAGVEIALDLISKTGEFQVAAERIKLLSFGAINLLWTACCTAGFSFVLVALTAGKPKFPTLFGIAVYASVVGVIKAALRMLLIAWLHRSSVETAASAFVDRPDVTLPIYLLLRRLDPFDLWWWCLIGVGLSRTGQCSRRAAFWGTLTAAILYTMMMAALDLVVVAEMPKFEDTK
jgi:hypothetical protein